MNENVRNDRPIVQNCGPNYTVFSDAGYMWPKAKGSRKHDCFYPSVHGLENIAKYYPNSTILVITRQVDAWIQSAHVTWKPSIIKRISAACSGFPGNFTRGDWSNHSTKAVDAWANYYTQHTESIRNFSMLHNLTYIEASLEDPNLAILLESKIGITRQCWGHANKITERRGSEAARKKEKEAQVNGSWSNETAEDLAVGR
jgi:hypothetical protein